jgi:hypothetical protein
MAVVDGASLVAIGRALARIHVEHGDARVTPFVHRVDPSAPVERREWRGSPAEPVTRSRSCAAGRRLDSSPSARRAIISSVIVGSSVRLNRSNQTLPEIPDDYAGDK